MAADLSGTLTIAVSARALFDLEADHRYYGDHGLKAYHAYQMERVDVPPARGTAFPLESVCRQGVPAGAGQDATLRRMRADIREGGGLCNSSPGIDMTAEVSMQLGRL